MKRQSTEDGSIRWSDLVRDPDEERRIAEIQRAADRVSALILYTDLPLIDIRLAAAGVRRMIRSEFPERIHLYEWLYAARFRRLWEQWRGQGDWGIG